MNKMEKIETNTKELEKLIITRNTLKKIQLYSNLVCKKGNFECYGFLLNPKKEKNNIVYNAILAHDQIVSGGHATVHPEGIFKSKAEIENLGYDMIGFWHSHHSMGAWHSTTDDNNLEKLASSIAGNREILLVKNDPIKRDFERNKFLIREDGIQVEIKSPKALDNYLVERKVLNPEINYMHTKKNKFYLNLGGKTISLDLGEHTLTFKQAKPEKLRSLGYAYSLVVSNKDVYAEVCFKEICAVCEHRRLEKKPIKLNVIEVPEDINYTETELKQEIKNKVRKQGLLSMFS